MKLQSKLAVRFIYRMMRGAQKLTRVLTRDGRRTFFDPADFPWVPDVEADWPAIRRELDALLEDRARIPNFQDISVEQRTLTTDDRWKTFFFRIYGDEVPDNCTRCPATARALRKIPGMTTGMFSILDGPKHIPPHTGPYNGVLRYHLAVRVPGNEGQCRIRVGEDVRPWHEGKSLVFDDSLNHEAWNDTNEIRAVLFVDIIRPLPWPLSALNRIVLGLMNASPFVQNALDRLHEHAEGAQADQPAPAAVG